MLFIIPLVFIGCGRETEHTIIQYAPHMANTPVLKPQRGYEGFANGASVLVPPEGTIPRGFKPYRIESAEEAEQKLVNPLPITREVLLEGQKRYQISCYPCHGERGLGDGPVVPPYPIPKTLHSEQMRKWKDGHIFHVITKGQAVMPNYAQQISEKDRWAIVHYVRALQRAENPSAADVAVYKSKKVN
jgi:cytochrome c553